MGKSNKFSLATKSHLNRVNPYDKITSNALNVTCPDKQIILPKLESSGHQHVTIELYSLLIFVIALGTQYLNLYRSVWWLSKTRNNHHHHHHQPISTSNYHLIDYDVSQFSLIFIGQSTLITILRALMNKSTIFRNSSFLILSCNTSHLFSSQANNKSVTSNNSTSTSASTLTSNSHTSKNTSNNHNNNNHQNGGHCTSNGSSEQRHSYGGNSQTTSTTTSSSSSSTSASSSSPDCNKITLGTLVTATASWICNYYMFKCAYRIWSNFGINGLSSISYPIVLSLVMNSTHIMQVVDGCRKTGKLQLSLITLSITIFSSHISFYDDKLCHNCSNQPEEIRDEVDRLKTIFNERLKFVLFKSILLAYYSSFVPLCFANNYLYFDYNWTAQHVVITWLSSFIMLISSSYTPYFYDVLHRSAFHFGKWQKLESRNTLVPCINWSENVIYPQGVVVKHFRGYFRSESVSNCAQPGVSSHFRYYIIFSNPRIGYTATLCVLAMLLTAQMYLLLAANEWYKLIAMTNMMLINIHSIFRLVKSLIIITKIYKERR